MCSLSLEAFNSLRPCASQSRPVPPKGGADRIFTKTLSGRDVGQKGKRRYVPTTPEGARNSMQRGLPCAPDWRARSYAKGPTKSDYAFYSLIQRYQHYCVLLMHVVEHPASVVHERGSVTESRLWSMALLQSAMPTAATALRGITIPMRP